MNNYAYLIKAKAKAADAKNLFCWFSAKTDARADREILNMLEDAGIAVGRSADYQLPVRTDWHIVDDLPEEGVLDDTWCDRYQLAENGTSWLSIASAGSVETPGNKPGIDTDTSALPDNPHEKPPVRMNDNRPPEEEKRIDSDKLSLNIGLAHYWLGGMLTLTLDERDAAISASMDTDNSFLQNVILAVNNVEALKHCHPHIRHGLVAAIRAIWPVDGKIPELNQILAFCKEWIAALNDLSPGHKKHRADVMEKWQAKVHALRTPSGAIAGGLNMTDRGEGVFMSTDLLAMEVALGLLARSMDFDIYAVPGSIVNRARDIVRAKEKPFSQWFDAYNNMPGGLDYSRAIIIYSIKCAPEDLLPTPGKITAYLNKILTETDHAHPCADIVAAACGISQDTLSCQTENDLHPADDSVSNSVFSQDGLVPDLNSHGNHDGGEQQHVQMEKNTGDEAEAVNDVSPGKTETDSTHSRSETGFSAEQINSTPGHHNPEGECTEFTHLMVDLETMGTQPDAPIVSIGAVFFEPSTGLTGPAFYETIDLASAMSSGALPDAATILWWLRQSSDIRSAILVDTLPLDEGLMALHAFIRQHAVTGMANVQLWGNGASFDNVLLRRSYERAGLPCELTLHNDRDVRTLVELGKAIGIDPRNELPFDGHQHNALADAMHQVKYVSAIWQCLTQN